MEIVKSKASLALGAFLLVALSALSGCGATSSGSGSNSAPEHVRVDCESWHDSLVEAERANDSDFINQNMNQFGDACPSQHSDFIDYISARNSVESGTLSCADLHEFGISAHVESLLFEEGTCSVTDLSATPVDSGGTGGLYESTSWPEGGIGWDEAAGYVGTSKYVCGPIADASNTEWGVFINLGNPYPNPDRFTFISWDYELYDFPPVGVVACAQGEIYLYEGVTQMEVPDPGQIHYWE